MPRWVRLLPYVCIGLTHFIPPTAQHVPSDLPDPPCNRYPFEVLMSDGVVLPVTVYCLRNIQLGTARLPVNYQAFPYDAFTEKAILLQWSTGQLLDLQPPHLFLIQHMRGIGNSSGRFDGFRSTQDMADTVAWLRAREWWNGVLYGTGTSAMGVMTYLSALVGVPTRAQAVNLAGASEFEMVYQNGAFRSALVNGMLQFIDQPQYNATYVEHEGPGEWWNRTSLADKGPRLTYPAVHMAGWYDVFQQQTLDVYRLYRTAADPSVRDLQFLIVQPQGHCFAGGAVKWPPLSLSGLDSLFATFAGMLFGVLKDAGDAARFRAGLGLLHTLARGIPRVFWFVMGPGLEGTKGNWIAAGDDFPTPSPTPLYLSPIGLLKADPPTADAAISFLYDPSNPLGTHGGNNMGVPPLLGTVASLPCGPWDQLPFHKSRRDILSFTSSPLPGDFAITGRVRAVLFVSSNATDTDFTVSLSDVFPNGTRLLIADGIQRMRWRSPDSGPQAMVPGVIYKIEVDLWSTSYIFPPTHSVGVDISSSNFPRFDANPNTGALLRDTAAGGRTVVAENVVHAGVQAASHILLPVVPVSTVGSAAEALLRRFAPKRRRTVHSPTALYPTA